MSFSSFHISNETGSTHGNQELGQYMNKYILDNGVTGPTGPSGAVGASGATGVSGGVVAAADFYAVMPGDNAATIAVGADLNFPNDGPIYGSDISRLSANTFQLASVGLYQVMWQVSVDEPGQLIVHLNAAEVATTAAGRATGTNQIMGLCLINTVVPNAVLSIRNPAGNAAALTITPIAGGAHSVSAHLVITRLA